MEHAEDIGKVIAIEGKNIKVELDRGGGCKSCAMRGMCFAKNTPAVFVFENDKNYKVGDKVLIDIAPESRIVSSLLVFLMPVVFLFAGFMLADIWLAELPSIGIAFASMTLSFLIMRAVDKRYGKSLRIRLGELYEDQPQ